MGYGMNSCLATPIIARFPLDTLYSYFLCFILLLLAFLASYHTMPLITYLYTIYLGCHYLFAYITSIAPHSVSIEEGMEAVVSMTMNKYTWKSIWKC
jgi:hypothetical protein